MKLDELFDYGKSEPKFSVWICRSGQICFIEPVPNIFHFFGINTDPCIFNFNNGFFIARFPSQCNGSIFCKLDTVFCNINKNLHESIIISEDPYILFHFYNNLIPLIFSKYF